MLTDFQVQNLTIIVLIPNITGTIPAMSVNNWIVIHQRLSTDNSIFKETFANYANGFGAINGSFWMGNEKVHRLTQTGSRPYMLLIEMLSNGPVWRSDSADYTSFSLDDKSQFYKLHVGVYSGDARNSLQYTGSNMVIYTNSMTFFTYDEDNDNFPNNYSCSTTRGSCGWLFNACHKCCLTCDLSKYARDTNPSNDVHHQVSRMMIKSQG